MLRTKLGSFYGNFVNPRENRIAETVCQQFRFWLKDEADERLAKNRNERAILFFLSFSDVNSLNEYREQ